MYVVLSILLGMFLGTFITIKQIDFYSVNVDSDGTATLEPAMPNSWFDQFYASFGINICLIVISLISSICFCFVRHYLYLRLE